MLKCTAMPSHHTNIALLAILHWSQHDLPLQLKPSPRCCHCAPPRWKTNREQGGLCTELLAMLMHSGRRLVGGKTRMQRIAMAACSQQRGSERQATFPPPAFSASGSGPKWQAGGLCSG